MSKRSETGSAAAAWRRNNNNAVAPNTRVITPYCIRLPYFGAAWKNSLFFYFGIVLVRADNVISIGMEFVAWEILLKLNHRQHGDKASCSLLLGTNEVYLCDSMA